MPLPGASEGKAERKQICLSGAVLSLLPADCGRRFRALHLGALPETASSCWSCPWVCPQLVQPGHRQHQRLVPSPGPVGPSLGQVKPNGHRDQEMRIQTHWAKATSSGPLLSLRAHRFHQVHPWLPGSHVQSSCVDCLGFTASLIRRGRSEVPLARAGPAA